MREAPDGFPECRGGRWSVQASCRSTTRNVIMLAQEIIRHKRDGHPLERVHIDAFVRGLVDESWSDAQAAAMAMAVFLEGMSHEETMDLTDAMTRSGTVLDWPKAFPGPIL